MVEARHRMGYHAFSTGHMVNGLTSRITSRSPGQCFAVEVCAPLGPDADFRIGTAPESEARISSLIMGNPAAAPEVAGEFTRFALFNPLTTPVASRTGAWRRAEIGGVNGHGNARAALIQSVVANGGEVGGVRLLSEETCALAVQEQFSGMDLVMGILLSWGVGYCTGGPLLEQVFGPKFKGHRGAFWGGGRFHGALRPRHPYDRRLRDEPLAGRSVRLPCPGIVQAAYDTLG
jgi:hypothetical protein